MGNPGRAYSGLAEPVKMRRLPFSILSAKRFGANRLSTSINVEDSVINCDIDSENGNNSKLSLTGMYLANKAWIFSSSLIAVLLSGLLLSLQVVGTLAR